MFHPRDLKSVYERVKSKISPSHPPKGVIIDFIEGQNLEIGDAGRFIEEFNRLKNERLSVKIACTVIEGAETKTKELLKGDINFYGLFYPGYEAYLAGIRDDVKASKLLEDLRRPTHHN